MLVRQMLGGVKATLARKVRIALGRSDFRELELYGLLPRPSYAYGLLRAADLAGYFGAGSITVCEFGVASGAGLLAMVNFAARVQAETGVTFRIFGFDSGKGLPRVRGYKDHPELWLPGDFPMGEVSALQQKIAGRAILVLGEIEETLPDWMRSLSQEAPVGFLAIDVDTYSGAAAALKSLTADAACYLPAVSLYFDDVDGVFANRWCGELAAIEEFNERHSMRKIDHDRSLQLRPKPAYWHQRMYMCHILDHPARNRPRRTHRMTIQEHGNLIRKHHLK